MVEVVVSVGLLVVVVVLVSRAVVATTVALLPPWGQPLGVRTIILPKIVDTTARALLKDYIDALLEGRSTVEKTVGDLTEGGKMPKIDVRARSHHVVLV